MRVHLFKPKTIADYVLSHQNGKIHFESWLARLRYADWNQPADMKNTFPKTDALGAGSNRVVFDVGGNHYRMICRYHFGKNEVCLFVCWLGTHAEYTKLCADNQQYTVFNY